MEAAGDLTLRYFQTGVRTELKADDSPVTIADREAELLIRERIQQRFPDHGILGEEFGTEGTSTERWVIDPIDGTKSFVCGVPLYGCLLSFEVDETPVVALVYFPPLKEMLYAVQGGGAYCNGQPIRVSNRPTLSGSVVCSAGHNGMKRKGISHSFETNVVSQCMATRTWCDAYGHALVAKGQVEAMVDPYLKHYDISAPWLLVREAGGRVTDFAGNVGLALEAISSNGFVHGELLVALGSGT